MIVMKGLKAFAIYLLISLIFATTTCYLMKSTGQSRSILLFFFFVPLQFVLYVFFVNKWGKSSFDLKYFISTLLILLITEFLFYIDLAINVGATRIVFIELIINKYDSDFMKIIFHV